MRPVRTAFLVIAATAWLGGTPAPAQQLQNSLDGTIRIPFSAETQPGPPPNGYGNGGNRLGRSGGAGIDLRRTMPPVGGSLDLSNSSPFIPPSYRQPGDLR